MLISQAPDFPSGACFFVDLIFKKARSNSV